MNLRCPHCHNAFELSDRESTSYLCPLCQTQISVADLVGGRPGDSDSPDSISRRFKYGDRIGHFEIREFRGQGSYGSVYRAFDTRLEREVAIKLPRISKNRSQSQIDLFLRDAQAAAQISDPNIVAIHEIGRQDDLVYIVSDFIDGETLLDWSQRTRPGFKQAVKMAEKVARAIHRAHEKGIVHRDLKPTNILVVDDEPKIMDFGLANCDQPYSMTILSNGCVLGTPAYMSPEQAIGQTGKCDLRTDIYSCGVLLYEMLAGERPFKGEQELLVEEICQGKPKAISSIVPDVDRDLEVICLKSMSIDPDDRYSTALEFADELARFRHGVPIRTSSRSFGGRFALGIKQNMLSIAVSVAILLFALTAAIIYSNMPKNSVVAFNFDKVDVEVTISHPGAVLRAQKINPLSNSFDYIDEGRIDRLSSTGFVLRNATPGWYIFEAYVQQVGIQEVWRYVPSNKNDVPSVYAHSKWEIFGNRIKVADITIIPFVVAEDSVGFLGDHEFSIVDGGMFQPGSEGLKKLNGSIRRPLESSQLQPSFLLARTETTNLQYSKVMNQLTGLPTHPVTNITFLEALAYAEKIGARLPVFDEYVYAATNGGTTKLPWGNDFEKSDFRMGPVGFAEFDKTNGQNPILGLCSGVQEWLQDIDIPIDILTTKSLNSPLLRDILETRMVAGGCDARVQNGIDEKEDNGPRYFENAGQHEKELNLGFRCARSITPRLGPVPAYVSRPMDNGEKVAAKNP